MRRVTDIWLVMREQDSLEMLRDLQTVDARGWFPVVENNALPLGKALPNSVHQSVHREVRNRDGEPKIPDLLLYKPQTVRQRAVKQLSERVLSR